LPYFFGYVSLSLGSAVKSALYFRLKLSFGEWRVTATCRYFKDLAHIIRLRSAFYQAICKVEKVFIPATFNEIL